MYGNINSSRLVVGFLKTAKRLKHFVTTPIFYANGPPHIGHLYTAVLADAFHRWELLKIGGVAVPGDNNSLFTTGTDEHGLKIQRTAAAVACDPLSYCNDISDKFRNLLRTFSVQPTDFIRTTEARHKKVVECVWKELENRGRIEKGKYEGWYSVTDECFYSTGEVQKVPGEDSVVSKVTGTAVDWVEEENYVFPISKYYDAIRNWLSNNDVIRPSVYVSEVLQHSDLEGELSISRDRKRISWGIPVPGDNTQTVYVWFDALVNYLTVSGVFGNMESANWPPTCQIIGKDILNYMASVLTRIGSAASEANFCS